MRKEYIYIFFMIIYLLSTSIKNWGKIYSYRPHSNIPKTKEDECRQIFEDIFKIKFKKIRPDFLKNPKTGKNLELDGYCPYIPTKIGKGLAFEFNGPQHYLFTPKYHSKYEDLEYQMERDEIKNQLCKNNGVILITIPYTVTDLKEYIINELYMNDLYIYL